MLTISEAQLDALVVAHEEDYRRRAFAHARESGALDPQSPDEALRPPFDFAEQVAAQHGIEAEQSRLALFMLAAVDGPQQFHRPEVIETLAEREVDERVRVRLVIDMFDEDA